MVYTCRVKDGTLIYSDDNKYKKRATLLGNSYAKMEHEFDGEHLEIQRTVFEYLKPDL